MKALRNFFNTPAIGFIEWFVWYAIALFTVATAVRMTVFVFQWAVTR